jgi:hypothetical protein
MEGILTAQWTDNLRAEFSKSLLHTHARSHKRQTVVVARSGLIKPPRLAAVTGRG